MKGRLRCILLGHDFRIIIRRKEMLSIGKSDYCRNCGLTKKELEIGGSRE